MSSPYVDCVYIVGQNVEQAEAVRQAVSLRGFDRVSCYALPELLEQGPTLMHQLPPDLVILDPQGHYNQAFSVMNALEPGVPVIFLAESFDEEVFLNCFDAGARDFLVKPVATSYLISRALMALEGRRTQAQLLQRNQALLELGVIGPHSNMFTTEYFIRALKRCVHHAQQTHAPLSLVAIQAVPATDAPNMPEGWRVARDAHMAADLIACCRGGDIVGEYLEDGYLIALPGTGPEGAQTVARRIRRRFDYVDIPLGTHTIAARVTVAGVSAEGCRHYEDVINRALAAVRQDASNPVGV